MIQSLNSELFNPHYIYNGLGGTRKWDKYLVEAFTEPAQRFLKSGKDKLYTYYQEGTSPHREFWDRELDRWNNGYTVDGIHCPSLQYIYLNYCPIWNAAKKLYTFPEFWDLDFDHFTQIEKAEAEKKHFCEFKARRRGASLKGGVPIIKNLHTIRGSMNYIMAFNDSHASKTWSMVKHYLNHINKTTAFYKSRNPDTTDSIKMARIAFDGEGRKIEKGYLSELHKVVFKDAVTKGVGGAISLAILEEAGVWSNLEDVLEYIKPATQDGDIVSGLILMYGSVGELSQSKMLKEIFYNPSKHGFLSFPNYWGIDSSKGKECGYYIPEYICMKPYIDEWGNSDIEAAMAAIDKNREKEKKKNIKSFSLYRSQHPIYPEEGFMARGMSKFPAELISKQLANIEGNDFLKHYGRAVKLQEIDGKIKLETLHNRLTPFNEWPVDFKKHTEGLEGYPWIYEAPMPDTPYELYIGGTDSVDKDNLGKLNSDSLFVMYIYKRSSGLLTEYVKREIVASLIGRPEIIADIYEQAEYLEKLYNAKNLVENGNPGILIFHNNRNTGHYLQDELIEIQGLTPNSNVRNKKGYNPTVSVRNHGDGLIVQYLKEVLDTEFDENGEIIKQVFGVERIKDIGLLKEMLGYDEDSNCDRLDAFRGCLLYEEALLKREITLNNGTSISDQFASRVEKSRKKKNSIVW